MADVQNENEGAATRVFSGRRRILCSAARVDASNVEDMLSRALVRHALNAADEDYLHNYFLGRQPVLLREKEVRPSINNKVVENRAYQIAKDRADSLVGEPVTYSAHGAGATHEEGADATDEVSHRVQVLNDRCTAADKHACDLELVQWMCEVGVGYRLVMPTEEVAGEGAERPFRVAALDPRSTFVVYRNDAFREPLFAAAAVRDEVTGVVRHTVYTASERFVLEGGLLAESGPNPLGMVPIIEYDANPERMGVFEAVLGIFDAINEIESNRVDGVAQFVQNLLVFENVDFDHDDWDEMCRKGAVLITSTGEVAAKVYSVSAELNQQQTQTLVDSLYKNALSICGMPFNVGGSASTSDTGVAVTMRDGWSNSENRCKETEAMFKRSERRFLDCALAILETSEHLALSSREVEIKFTRRNYEALQSKAQVFSTLAGTGKLHLRTCIEQCGLFPDPESVYDQAVSYIEEQDERKRQQDERQLAIQQATAGGDAGVDSKGTTDDGGVTAKGQRTRPATKKRSQREEDE